MTRRTTINTTLDTPMNAPHCASTDPGLTNSRAAATAAPSANGATKKPLVKTSATASIAASMTQTQIQM